MDQPVRRGVMSRLHYLAWPAALALAGWILSRLPLRDSLQSVSSLGGMDWTAWIALNLAILLLLTGRWLVLTRAMGLPIRLLQLLRVRQGGQVVSFVTPGPQFGGEPLQVYWLWKKHGLTGPDAFLAVGLDRFYELWVNFAILLVAVVALLTSSVMPGVNWQAIALLLFALLSGMALTAWALLRQPTAIRYWINRVIDRWRHSARLSQLQEHWSQINASMQRLFTAHRPALGLALVLSLLAWAGMILELWLLLGFVGVPREPSTFILLFALIRLAFLLPLPGGVGSLEATLLWAFQALALPLQAAAGLIVLMRLRDVLLLLLSALALPGLHRSADRQD